MGYFALERQALLIKRFFLPALGIALAALGGTAQAQTIIASGPVMGGAGAPGLAGRFYYTNGASVTSIAQAQQYLGSNAQTGTFTATEAGITGSVNGFGYFAHDADSAGQFLQVGDDGRSYVGPTTTLGDGIFDFRGTLNVLAPGTLQFSTFSDDGSAIFIAGQQVVLNDGVHTDTTANGAATFALAGLYPVELVYFNHAAPGFQSTAALQASFGGAALAQPVPAPELSGAAGLCIGLLGLGLLACRARRRTASGAA